MNALSTFDYEGAAVRTVAEDDGEIWFVARDVCEVLEIEHYRNATQRLDDDERGSVLVNTLGGSQELSAVNESGLYALIFRSRKAKARLFRKWVTSEVLPSIRKTGGYGEQSAATDLLPLEEEKLWHGRITLYRRVYGSSAARWMLERSPLPVPPPIGGPDVQTTRAAEHHIATFFGDETEPAPGHRLGAGALYQAYARWAHAAAIEPETNNLFARIAGELGFKTGKSGTKYYRDIRLREPIGVT